MESNDPICLRVTLPLVGSNVPPQAILHLGLALKNEVEKMGGRAKCFKIPDLVVVEMSGISRDRIEKLIHSVGNSTSMQSANLNMVIEERTAPEIDWGKKEALPGEFLVQRLTKKFLLSLPDGAIIVGNEFWDGVPKFMVRLHEGQNRSRIWSLAVSKEAAQRICHVYWYAEDVRAIHGVDHDRDLDDEDEESELDPFAR